MKNLNLQTLWPATMMIVLFLTAVFFRPLLPIDETRYMSVAWEMYLRGDWLAPLTLNFELYHHKPPVLFWMINAAWSAFGVSRWAGLLPVVIMSAAFVYLTRALALNIFKFDVARFENLPFIVTASFPFLMYGTIVMFDVTLTVCVLSAFLALLAYAEDRRWIYILALAAAIGVGVLTKGPVAWLYVIFPMLLAPIWMDNKSRWRSWYSGCGLALLLSVIPVAFWLIPVLKASNPDFAFSLIWEQTAGRVSGKMGASHDRPIYFYLPLLPAMVLPWAFFPSFWKGLERMKEGYKTSQGVRFITCWIVPVFIAFCLIGGKQPHYLLPLLPGVLILTAYGMQMEFRRVVMVSASVIAILVGGQMIASQSFLKKYDLQPIADYVKVNEDHEWLFVPKYQGEITFLGRLGRSMDYEFHGDAHLWFRDHPQGMAVIRYAEPSQVEDYEMIMTMPYRSKNIGIFKSQN